MKNKNYKLLSGKRLPGGARFFLSAFTLLAACLLTITRVEAQISAYTFAQSTGTYTSITGGTQLYSGSFDDGSTNFTLPFSFTFNGTAYTNAWVSANGHIVFGGASDPTGGIWNQSSVISQSFVTTGAVAGWAGDLSGWSGILGGQTSEVRAEVIGTSPNRVAVFQWRSRPAFSTSSTLVSYLSFQIRLLEGSNNVQIVYGPSGQLAGTTNQTGARQVGLRGANNTQFNNRSNGTTVSFNSSVAGTINSATQNFSSVNATPGRPTNGLTYTWTPPAPCTSASGGTITPASASRCAGQTYAMTSVGATAGTGITYQWEVSTTGGGAGFTSVTGGTGATTTSYTTGALAAGTYYYRLTTTCASGPVGSSNEVTVVVNALPTVAITASNGGNFCGNGTLTASGASTYSWAPANALSATTGSTVTSTATTSRTFTVVGTDVNGCTSSASLTSVYSAPAPVTVTASEGGVFCGTGGTTTIEATSNVAYTYTFTAIDGAVLSNITATTADATVTQTSAIQVNAFDASTGCAVTSFVSVGVYPLPTATVTTTANGVCPGTSATINSGLQAGNFTVSSIPVTPSVIPPTATFLMNNGVAVTPLSGGSLDDGGWGGIPIGFNFDFFGTTFNTLAAGTNGLLMFGSVPGYGTSTGQLGQFTFVGPPFFPNASNPGNIIALMATDLHMGTNTTNASISYWTQGYAPNRVFIIKYTNVNGYSANPAATVEARLYETLGMVDIVITNKTFSNQAIVGLQNATKTIGAVAPGRAGGSWTVTTPEAWRFNPPSNYTTIWTANGVEIANGTNIFSQSVAPAVTTQYEIIYTNQLTLCSNEPGSAVVNMAVLSPNPPSGVLTNGPSTVCVGGAVALSTDYTGSLDGLSFQWEVSTDGGTTWASIPGATSITASTTQSVASVYRCAIVSCGSAPTYSSNLSVGLDPSAIAGTVTGPAFALTSVPQLYITTGSSGPLRWLFKTNTGTTWSVIANATDDTLNATFASPGIYNIRAVAGATGGCAIDSSNIITTTVTLGNDNACESYPVNIGNNGPYTNVGATLQPGESVPPTGLCTGNASWCTAADNTVWFRFTVPGTGSGRYAFAVPGWDSQVAVWSASSCVDLISGTATLVVANDDSLSSPYNAYVPAYCLSQNTTYYIQVDGYGTTTNGAFTLRIDDLGPVSASFTGLPSDICQNAAAVTLVPAVAGGTFTGNGVTGSTFDPAAVGPGVYTITYRLGGGDTCRFSSQQVTVNALATYYADADGDGFGDAAMSVSTCSAMPAGYVSNSADCNDNQLQYADVDGDGFGAGSPVACGVASSSDCNDGDAAVNPGATEVCNGIDDNCNGLTDEGLSLATPSAINGTATACLPGVAGTVNFSTPAVAGATSYNWSVPSGMTITAGIGTNSITVSYTATAIQNGITGQLCVTALNPCVSSASRCVSVNYQITAPITPGSISGPTKACPGDVINLSVASVLRASSYNWTVPATMTIQSGQGTNVISVLVNAGFTGGTVAVTASNVCGTSAIRSRSITLNPPATPGVIQGNRNGLCNSNGNVFSVPVVSNATSYAWSVTGAASVASGNGTNSVAVNVGTLAGSATLTVRAVNGCGTSSARSLSITGTSAQPGVISGATSPCNFSSQPYSVATVAGAASYNWGITANGSVAVGQGTKNITVNWGAAATGQGLNVTAANACGNSPVRSLSPITIGLCARVADELSAMQMVIMPNPASGFANIRFNANENGDYRLRITDLAGRVVFIQDANAGAGVNNIALDLSSYAAGMYTVQLDFNGEQQVTRMMVE